MKPNPEDKQAMKLYNDYQESYEKEFLSSAEGQSAHEAIEGRAEILYITFDPDYKGDQKSMVVKNYQYDESGNIIAATLVVGPHWSRCCPAGDSYPVSSKMDEDWVSRKWMRVQRIAHEEQGHFMLLFTDEEYASTLKEKEAYNCALEEYEAEVAARYPDDPKKQMDLKLEFTKEYTPSVSSWGRFLESSADMRSLDFLPEDIQRRVNRMIEREKRDAERLRRREEKKKKRTDGTGESKNGAS